LLADLLLELLLLPPQAAISNAMPVLPPYIKKFRRFICDVINLLMAFS
jgi:hypothetical protein